MAWFSSGRITNPTLDQVLVDTGQLSAGSHAFWCSASATVQCAMEVQLRDATNTSTLKSQILAVQAYDTKSMPTTPEGVYFAVNANERIRIIAVAAVTGSVSASIFTNS